MAESSGRIARIHYAEGTLCAILVLSPDVSELVSLRFNARDDAATTRWKRSLALALTTALISQRQVTIFHADGGSAATALAFVRGDISPVGPAIHGDFYAVTGAGFADDSELVFETAAGPVPVTPDLRRPHWLLVERLPDTIPTGLVEVSVRSRGRQSASVPVRVQQGPPLPARTLYSGRPTSAPYTFVFAATPVLRKLSRFVPDTIMDDRPAFHDLVAESLVSLLTEAEDLLRIDGAEREIRFVAIFDPLLSRTDKANALVRESKDKKGRAVMVKAVRGNLKAFARRYREDPDIFFGFTKSAAGLRAGGTGTDDDWEREAVSYVYDGVRRMHGRFASTPGCSAITTQMNRRLMTPLHEFGHAASRRLGGRIRDLYNDDGSPFTVNKKWRKKADDPVPALFATYNGVRYASDPDRAGLGYRSGQLAYHPVLIDKSRPNLMDRYRDDPAPKLCRFDRLTYDWLRDRLAAKLRRSI
jgi:hypothetical protein